MTLGDRLGPAADRSHRPGGTTPPPATGADTSGPGMPPGSDDGWPRSPWSGDDGHDGSADRPAFGPHPPRSDRPADTRTAPDGPHLGAPPHPADAGYAEADLDDGHTWYARPPRYTNAPPPGPGRPATDGPGYAEPPTDPFGDTGAGFVRPPDPPWSRPADDEPPPRRPDSDRAYDGGVYDQEKQHEDEVLPPSEGVRRREGTVSTLQPANVYRVAPAKAGPAGPPPSQANGAAVLCGLLAVPMLAAAGALAATGDLPLPVVLLAMAVCSVLGGIRMIRRGSPLPPLLCAAGTVVVAVVGVLSKPLVPSPMGTVLGVVFTLYVGLVLIMIGLLRTRRTRRWLAARGREWLEQHPPKRRRLPAVTIPLPKLPKLRRRTRSRKPKRVKQMGRHVKARRRGPFRSRRPVSYVGRDAPSHDRRG